MTIQKAVVGGLISVLALPLAVSNPVQHGEGSGPYPVTYFAESTLYNHTIYMPFAEGRDETLPVLVWGEGGCENNGTKFFNFLTNVASYGFIIFASGPPENGAGNTDWHMMTDAIDWITEKSNLRGLYNNVDANRIAVAGQSCGGLETYKMRSDNRVSFLGIFNSGFIANTSLPGGPNIPDIEAPAAIHKVHKPVFYFLGGPTDIAYGNGERDYHNLRGVPKWIGNYPGGHQGTYDQANGGAYGMAAVKWLLWTLKKDTDAAGFFRNGGAEREGWNRTESYGLEDLQSFAQ